MFAHLEALHGAGGNVLSQTFLSPWYCEGGGACRLVITGDSCSTWNAIGGFSNAKELLLNFNDRPIWQHRGRVSTAVWRRWQKSGSMVMAAVAMMMTMKTKVTEAEVAAFVIGHGFMAGNIAR